MASSIARSASSTAGPTTSLGKGSRGGEGEGYPGGGDTARRRHARQGGDELRSFAVVFGEGGVPSPHPLNHDAPPQIPAARGVVHGL